MANYKNENQVSLNFRIDKDKKNEFKKLLNSEGKKIEFVLNEFIENYINEKKKGN